MQNAKEPQEATIRVFPAPQEFTPPGRIGPWCDIQNISKGSEPATEKNRSNRVFWVLNSSPTSFGSREAPIPRSERVQDVAAPVPRKRGVFGWDEAWAGPSAGLLAGQLSASNALTTARLM